MQSINQSINPSLFQTVQYSISLLRLDRTQAITFTCTFKQNVTQSEASIMGAGVLAPPPIFVVGAWALPLKGPTQYFLL